MCRRPGRAALQDADLVIVLADRPAYASENFARRSRLVFDPGLRGETVELLSACTPSGVCGHLKKPWRPRIRGA
ncbi:hypothetical protein Arub01_52100 [Actinomadura rubrobrunea]|uniref:Uncharacterized protein n=1 Tax=Actinomadura rubrobrunea TaxID=115335 RepID=A0A9W6PZU4_9ACTN|nr:hypothetical protein Arub01_52100 [Actinomadura rubrobrunea]